MGVEFDRMVKLIKKWRVCTDCQLGEDREERSAEGHGGKYVGGKGNPASDVLLWGMAPGGDEDDKGLPFVGRAGEILDMLLSQTGLHYQGKGANCFIDNLVPCRACMINPDTGRLINRDPTKKEIRQCRARMEKILQIVQPKVVVMLGELVRFTIFGGKIVNSPHMYRKKVAFLSMIHPAYYLRVPDRANQVRHAIQQWKTVGRQVLAMRNHEKPNIHWKLPLEI